MFDNLTINIPSELKLTLNINWNPKIEILVRKPLKRPGPIILEQVGEAMDQIRLRVKSSADEDTETREVKYSINDGEAVTLTYPIGTPETFLVPQGAKLHVEVVDIDDGGNRSAMTEYNTDSVADTFAPAAPGEVEMEAVAEE